MKKIYLWLAAMIAIAALIFAILWLPFADSPARDAMGVEKTIDREGRALAYYVSQPSVVADRSDEAEQTKSIMMIASGGREASDFNELAASLNQAGYRTIAVEAPGIKGSALPKDGFTLFDIADDIKAVADHELGANGKLAIIGHAYGNRVARAFASRNDDRVTAVALIAAGGDKPVPEAAFQKLQAIFDPWRRSSLREADIADIFFAEKSDIADHWLTGWHRDTAAMQAKATGVENYAKWEAGGSKPMLVLQAAEDAIAPLPNAGLPLAAKNPERVELLILPDTGHALLPEKPAIIAEEIVRFLDKVSGW